MVVPLVHGMSSGLQGTCRPVGRMIVVVTNHGATLMGLLFHGTHEFSHTLLSQHLSALFPHSNIRPYWLISNKHWKNIDYMVPGAECRRYLDSKDDFLDLVSEVFDG
jgi:hypothetical protein